MLCVDAPEGDLTIVTVLPVRHVAPSREDEGVEIPPVVKRYLGLDDEPSWVLVSGGNTFVWPGYDLRKRRKGGYSYGVLPPRLFDRIVRALADWHNAHGGLLVSRD